MTDTPESPFQQPHALIVEDSLRTRDTIARMLERLGFTSTCCSTPHEAIRIAAVERPAVILLDGLLPQMHGFELARILRQLDPGWEPRIVFMTGVYKHLRYRNEARLKYGIDEYLEKPIDEDRLRRAVAA